MNSANLRKKAMILLKYRNAIFFSLSIFGLIGLYSSKGGRGGGGARSGGGSRFGTSFRSSSNTRNGPSNSAGYRGAGSSYSSGVRWSSFGAGMVAYGVMSSLARRGPYGHSGYHSNYGYSGHQPRKTFIKSLIIKKVLFEIYFLLILYRR